MLVPLMPFVSASASANASTLINITDTIVNFPVNKNASRNPPGAANPVFQLTQTQMWALSERKEQSPP